MNKIKTNKTKGFTLIELIVVITIMMVVTMVGVVSFQAANKRSRDGRRIADLEKIRIALELYRQELGVYPNAANISGLSSLLVSKYMQVVPEVGPKGGTDTYQYARTTTAGVGSSYSYVLDAIMEDMGSTNSCPGCAGDYNYRVTNP